MGVPVMSEVKTAARRREDAMWVRALGLLFLAGLTLMLLSGCGDNGVSGTPPVPSYTAGSFVAATPSIPATAQLDDAPAAPTQVSPTDMPVLLPSGISGGIPPVVVPGIAEATPRQATPQPLGGSGVPDMGAPEWVKAGTRITFYSAAASVAQSRFAWVEDPNGPWADATTGKHYRRTDESGESVPTASGDGFSQIDVLARDGADVVLSMSLYTFDRANNQFVPSSGFGAKVPGATVDGAWVHPAQLAKLQEARLNGLLVLRGDYKLNGTTYQAISFANTTPGAYASYTYDTKTGLLLSATTSTAGATSPVSSPGQAPPQGNTQLTITRFVGYRQRALPGLLGRNPGWLARTSSLHYSGTYNFTNPVDPSSANLTYPMDITVSLGNGGPGWAPYTARTYIQMPGNQPSVGSGVTGSMGLYWIDSSALMAMKTGQLLDQDPLTGERVAVEAIDTQSGSPVVTISSQLPGVATNARYDQSSGVLVAYEAHGASNGTTIRLELQGRP